MTDERNTKHRGRARLATLMALVVAGSSVLPEIAAAQERRRGILEMLFGGPPRSQPSYRVYEAPPQQRIIRKAPRKKARTEVAPKRNNSPRSAAATAAAGGAAAVAASASTPVAKSEAARNVLVIGDFMAGSLAKGLDAAFATNRDIRVTNRADGSSGLVREDHHDWPASVGALIDETKADLVVVMLGANDRQGFRATEGTIALRSPEWADTYEQRAKALAEAIQTKKKPFLWVGMPAFQSDRATEDMVYLNDLFRNVAQAHGGDYVDIWNGFTDANGSFVTSGPDMAGQTVRLRNSDGITLTGAGQEKLAYFVEKPVTKVLGLNVEDFVASLGPQQLSAKDLPAVVDAALATTTAPISFADPRFDGGDQLLGSAQPGTGGQGSPREKLVREGVVSAAVEGRADQFNWTGRGTAVSPVTRDNAIVFRGTTSLEELRLHGPEAGPPTKPDAPAATPKAGTPDVSSVN
ncbi:SGNH/GDSL hydrolase family protein [Aureimonas sp. D3]|uniref:SGNH/GDSL hydrolase family protein n=1 Tax=Aureimonas sp. D3 TaxID=1638164 RepID=UPI000783CF94|nr:SGNH family hydrolase [Aureimonas sp. D3]